MTLHSVRTAPARGFKANKDKNGSGTTGVMVRLASRDFTSLRRIAQNRGSPMSAVIRDAIGRYLRGKGHA